MKITSDHHQNNNLSVIHGCKSSYNITTPQTWQFSVLYTGQLVLLAENVCSQKSTLCICLVFHLFIHMNIIKEQTAQSSKMIQLTDVPPNTLLPAPKACWIDSLCGPVVSEKRGSGAGPHLSAAVFYTGLGVIWNCTFRERDLWCKEN